MLVLGRRLNERIMIDNGRIVVQVVDVRPDGRVRLGITAPREVSVHREEVQAEIDRERSEWDRVTMAESQIAPAPAPGVAAVAERIVATLWDRDASPSVTPDLLWLYERTAELASTAGGRRLAAIGFVARVLAGIPRQDQAPARPGLPLTWLPGDAL